MKILTYRQLDSKDGLVPLLDHAFAWTFNQKQHERAMKIDPRLKKSPVSFCALEDKRIVGHVGVLDLATRTVERTVENVGGIFGVATLPGYTCRGIATALMEKAHEHFRERGYRFSLLGTRRVLVAHEWCKKLGYENLTECQSAYKVLKLPSKPVSSAKAGKIDVQKMGRIFSEFSKDRTGLVVRDESYLKTLLKVEEVRPKQCIVDEGGYAVFREDKSSIFIRELIALSEHQTDRLITLMEQRSKGIVCDRIILNRRLAQVYSSRGYMIEDHSHGMVMAKPLASGASVKETYGSDFFMSGLDGL